MRGDRDGEREHQDEIPDGLRREPCSGPPARCGAAGASDWITTTSDGRRQS